MFHRFGPLKKQTSRASWLCCVLSLGNINMKKCIAPWAAALLLLSPLLNARELSEQERSIALLLSHLPSWSSSDALFDTTGGDQEIPGEDFIVRREVDGEGHVVRIRLLEARTRSSDGEVHVCWKEGKMRRVDVMEGQRLLVSHLFSYDDHGRLQKHTLEGNLSGRADEAVEQYSTDFAWDDAGRLKEIHEQEACTTKLFYPEAGRNVVVQQGPNWKLRHAETETDKTSEEIEDDGTDPDIANVTGISWRVWQRRHKVQGAETLIVGAYDPETHKDVVLRREERRGGRVEVFDGSGKLVYTTTGVEIPTGTGSLASATGTYKECQQFIDGLGRVKSTIFANSSVQRSFDIFGNVTSEKTDEYLPKKVRYTARGTPYLIEYPDGSSEKRTYTLAGHETHCLSRDGATTSRVVDCQGRILEEQGKSAQDWCMRYLYQGPRIAGWSTPDGSCTLQRDIFGRVVEVCLNPVARKPQRFCLQYDALDRPTQVIARGGEEWEWRSEIAVDESTVKYFYQSQETYPSVVTVIECRSGGRLLSRLQSFSDCDKVETVYDEQERVCKVRHYAGGHWHDALEKSYTPTSETTRYSDGTCVRQESQDSKNQDSGSRDSRKVTTWMSPNGQELLQETLERRSDETELKRRAGGITHTVLWKFGPDERVHAVIVDGVRRTEFEHGAQGRLVAKKLPSGKKLLYSWDDNGRLLRLWSDDKSVDYQFCYEEGRVSKIYDAIARTTVVRKYDACGRLIFDGEEKTACQVGFGDDGVIQSLLLPGGEKISYQSTHVIKEGALSWKVEAQAGSQRTVARPLPLCCRPKSIEHKDPLGSWKQEYTYDFLNQLVAEKGTFHLSYPFTACGEIAPSVGVTYDADGLPVTVGEGKHGRRMQYDALGRLIGVQCGRYEVRYRYDGLSRLREIVRKGPGIGKEVLSVLWYDDTELGVMRGGRIFELRVPTADMRRPVVIEVKNTAYIVETDGLGSIISLRDLAGHLAEVYRYSAFGDIRVYSPTGERMRRALSPWLFMGKRWLSQAGCYDFGMRRYCPTLRAWLEHDPVGHIDGPDDRQYVRNNPALFFDKDGLFPWPVDWEAVRQSLKKSLPLIATNVKKSITFSKSVLDWVGEFRSSFEDLIFSVIGRGQLKLAGYNPDHSDLGVAPGKAEPAKARITAINGILNGTEEITRSAAFISSTHGDVPVHYVYAATEGFTGDILRGVFSKAGFLTRPARMLVELWRSLLQEMGGAGGGGAIVHYAHSLGATDTLNALMAMTEAERRCIFVRTIGAPTFIPSDLCARVDHYISIKDGVPLIDVYRYFQSMWRSNPNVHFLPSDATMFFADHVIDCKTYRILLESLGQKFQEEYCRNMAK